MTLLVVALLGLTWANTPDRDASSASHLLRTRSLARVSEDRISALEDSFAELLASEEREVSARCIWRMEHSPGSEKLRDFVAVRCRPSCDLSMWAP
jgi:hypothetical protein